MRVPVDVEPLFPESRPASIRWVLHRMTSDSMPRCPPLGLTISILGCDPREAHTDGEKVPLMHKLVFAGVLALALVGCASNDESDTDTTTMAPSSVSSSSATTTTSRAVATPRAPVSTTPAAVPGNPTQNQVPQTNSQVPGGVDLGPCEGRPDPCNPADPVPQGTDLGPCEGQADPCNPADPVPPDFDFGPCEGQADPCVPEHDPLPPGLENEPAG